MNCFSHALPSLDNAHIAMGSCIPDWLGAIDRKCRVRERKATPFLNHEDPIVANIAQGIVNHHQDDHWFHSNKTFQKMNIKLSVELREQLAGARGMRTGFVGHVMIELFLDAWLHAKFPGKLEYYYEQMETIEPQQVEDAINLFASKPTQKLAPTIPKIIAERYLFDYSENETTLYRMNRVLNRIGLEMLDDSVIPWMEKARQRVYDNAKSLLHKYAVEL